MIAHDKPRFWQPDEQPAKIVPPRSLARTILEAAGVALVVVVVLFAVACLLANIYHLARYGRMAQL